MPLALALRFSQLRAAASSAPAAEAARQVAGRAIVPAARVVPHGGR